MSSLDPARSGGWRDADDERGGFLQNVISSAAQDWGIARDTQQQRAYLRAMGTLSPERIPGYNPYEDPGVQAFLDANPTAGHLFRQSGSFIESQTIAGLAQERVNRERDLDAAGAGWSRFVAAMLDPVNLAMAPIGIGGLTAATTAGRAAQAAGRTALLGGVSELPFTLSEGDLPGDLQGDPVMNIALSAAFGAALGGLAGSVSRRAVERAAAGHGLAHDLNDGLRTPGVPPSPEAPRRPTGVLDEAPAARTEAMQRVDELGNNSGSGGRVTAEQFDVLRETLTRIVGPEARLQVNDQANGSFGSALGPVVRVAFWTGANEAGDTVRHESIHALRNLGKINDDEWAILSRASEAEGWAERHRIPEKYKDLYHSKGPERRAEALMEESIAYQFESFIAGDYKPGGVIGKIFQSMKEFVERLGNALRGLGYQSADDVMRAIEAGKMGARAGETPSSSEIAARRFFDDEADGPVFNSPDELRAWEAQEASFEERMASPDVSSPGNDDIMFRRGVMERVAPLPTKADLDRILPTGLGIEKALGRTWMPYYWLKNTKLAGTLGPAFRRLADQIVQTPGLQMAGVNVAGYAQATDSVEALKKQYGVRYHHAIGAQDAAYYKHMGWDPQAATPFRTRGTEVAQQIGLSKRDDRLTMEEFDQAVGLAVTGDGTSIPEVVNGRGVKVSVPEALEAAKVWREFYDRFEGEAAAAGVLLTARYKPAAMAAIQAEMDTRTLMIEDLTDRISREVADSPTQRAMLDQLADMETAQRVSKSRMEWLNGLSRTADPYVPHSWREGHVRRNRDRLATILQDEWAKQSPSTGGTTWAAPSVRAEIAISHILGDGIADTLERALFAYWKRSRPAEEAARLAADASASIRQLEAAMGPGKVRVEIDSLLGRRSPEDPKGAGDLARAVTKAVALPGMNAERVATEIMTVLGIPSTTDLSRPWNARQRQIDVPTKAVAEFLDLSQRAAGADYAWRMGASIEFSKRFGDPQMLNQIDGLRMTGWDEIAAGRATAEDVSLAIQAVKDLRDKVQGNFAIPEDASAYSVRGARFLVNTAVMAQMGGALTSQMADLGRVVMAHGLRNTLSAALDALNNKAAWTLAGDEARDAGAALELTNLGRTRELADLRDIGADVTLPEKFAQQGAQVMQFVNLTAPWTNMMQRFSGAMHQSAMIRMSAALVDGRLSPEDTVRLRAYGIDEQFAAAITANWRAAGGDFTGDLHLANTNAWTDVAAQRRFRAALATAVDISVMKPGAADRPNFMSAPLGQMIGLYKGFAIASTQRMLMAGMQQRDARVLSGMMASITITWLVQQATSDGNARGTFVNWDAIHDKDTQRAAEGGWLEFAGLANAIDRSGVLGIFADLNNALEMTTGNAVGIRPLLGITPPTYAKDPTWAQRVGAVGGAAVAPWLNLMWAMTADDAKGDQISGAVRRLIPFNNLLWVEWAFRALGREAGAAIGDPESGATE